METMARASRAKVSDPIEELIVSPPCGGDAASEPQGLIEDASFESCSSSQPSFSIETLTSMLL